MVKFQLGISSRKAFPMIVNKFDQPEIKDKLHLLLTRKKQFRHAIDAYFMFSSITSSPGLYSFGGKDKKK